MPKNNQLFLKLEDVKRQYLTGGGLKLAQVSSFPNLPFFCSFPGFLLLWPNPKTLHFPAG